MASLAVAMKDIDALIFDRVGEVALIGSHPVKGIFNNRYHQIVLSDNTIVGLEITFDCQYSPIIAALEEEDLIDIYGPLDSSGDLGPDLGTYRFIRRYPPKGDESGLVILELGSM